MSTTGVVVLDDEAVMALLDVAHPKHRRVLALVEAALSSPGSRRQRRTLVVPTTVRVEAGWNREVPRVAAINRLRALDHPLDRPTADRAASIRSALAVSVADAHLGATLDPAHDRTAIVTSDVDDIERIAAFVGVAPVIVRV